MNTDIKSMNLDELGQFLENIGERRFRAGQIFSWLYKGIYDFNDMTDLPLSLRRKLEEISYIERLDILRLQKSRKDGTRKYLFKLKSGNAIESVFMKYKFGCSICISSQAGCRMGCAFCASTIGGLADNLTASEMVDQIIAIEKDTGERISNVVVMGTGEPFDNYQNLCRFIELIHAKEGLNLSLRSVTVSTCGIIPGIESFGRDYPQVNLAISLHAPNDEIRSSLMPINRKYPMGPLMDACRRHSEETGRRITFEYALISGVNDKECHARELASKLSHMLCHVNLIPLNPVEESVYKGVERKKADQFREILENKRIPATIRRELGTEIDAACGQLRRQAGKMNQHYSSLPT